ncbi:hypothetical protein SAMN05216266_104294 [Amycolatopsis marina]|uniref:Uncharacterized protein n=1 Tax=Amycolatopsis marina TaxID=490629 RepID=A0A1I0Y9V0_9PSEU|nr:hypothetical protein SAMN05216266_104294 [Amycolatopsis marina]
MPIGTSLVGFAASSVNSSSPPRSTVSTGALYSTFEVSLSPVEVTVSVGWLATLIFRPSGVPLRMLMSAACMVEIDCTALRSVPLMSTSRTVDREDRVFGRLSTDPVPSESALSPGASSSPPRLASGPGNCSRPSFSGAAASVSWDASGIDGMTLSSERLASEVVESAMVPTQGPSVELHRACAVPSSRPTLSSGFSGALRPPFTAFGLSGSAVCTSDPGACGALPATEMPNGDDCAMDRS